MTKATRIDFRLSKHFFSSKILNTHCPNPGPAPDLHTKYSKSLASLYNQENKEGSESENLESRTQELATIFYSSR